MKGYGHIKLEHDITWSSAPDDEDTIVNMKKKRTKQIPHNRWTLVLKHEKPIINLGTKFYNPENLMEFQKVNGTLYYYEPNQYVKSPRTDGNALG